MKKFNTGLLVLSLLTFTAVLSGCENNIFDFLMNREQVETPSFSKSTGTYNSKISISISTLTEDAVIYYTTDGSDPDTESTKYDSEIELTSDGSSLTVCAYAVKEGMLDSETNSASYIINLPDDETPDLPGIPETISPENNAVIEGFSDRTVYEGQWYFDWTDAADAESYQLVVAYDGSETDFIDITTVDSEYYYTIRAQVPDAEYWYWKVCASVNDDTSEWSEESIFYVNSKPQNYVYTPVFTPAGGNYYEDTDVTISCTTEGAAIHYTTDGSTPDASSEIYSEPIHVSGVGTSTTIKAIGMKDGYTDSGIRSADYTITDAFYGYFKVANSWGIGSSWENVPDGFYRITYDAMKAQNVYAFIYADLEDYSPTHLAVFKISHDARNSCKVYFGIGNPEDPIVWKSFNSEEDFSSTNYSSSFGHCPGGEIPFSDNEMVFDVSEFSEYFGSNDFFIRIVDESGDSYSGGTLTSFTLEEYSDYNFENPAPVKTVSAGSLPLSFTDGETVSVVLSTSGFSGGTAVAASSGSRALISSLGASRKLTSSELSELKSDLGIAEQGNNYNLKVGGFGTGLRPFDEGEWDAIENSTYILDSKLLSIDAAALFTDGAGLSSIDWSETKYFPPIGSQGSEGSCVAWSLAYYIKTFQQALDNDRDVASASSNGYSPLSKLDWIYSPDYLYHQINGGVDAGSSYVTGMMVLDKNGCSSWATMPYSTSDHTSWPSETAWREGQLARSEYLKTNTEYGTLYYLRVTDDEDIRLLQTLLDQGILASISIDAYQYSNLSDDDIWDADNYQPSGTNHANTLVGYEDVEEYTHQ